MIIVTLDINTLQGHFTNRGVFGYTGYELVETSLKQEIFEFASECRQRR